MACGTTIWSGRHRDGESAIDERAHDHEAAIQLKQRLSRYAILATLALLGLKLWAWLASNSLAVLSDTINSTLDVFSYTTLAFSVRIQDKAPDNEHPYGHRRAEPLASMLIAIFAAVLGFNLVKDGVLGLFAPPELIPAPVAVWVMIIAIAVKILMTLTYRWALEKTRSLAIEASMIDSRNDVLATGAALLGYLVGGTWDALAATGIGLWIIWSGFRMGLANMGYLMGRTASPETLAALREAALSVPGVTGTNDVLAHYVGDELHVELHAEVDPSIDIVTGHEIETILRYRLEEVPGVGRAFIHLDPVPAPDGR